MHVTYVDMCVMVYSINTCGRRKGGKQERPDDKVGEGEESGRR